MTALLQRQNNEKIDAALRKAHAKMNEEGSRKILEKKRAGSRRSWFALTLMKDFLASVAPACPKLRLIAGLFLKGAASVPRGFTLALARTAEHTNPTNPTVNIPAAACTMLARPDLARLERASVMDQPGLGAARA